MRSFCLLIQTGSELQTFDFQRQTVTSAELRLGVVPHGQPVDRDANSLDPVSRLARAVSSYKQTKHMHVGPPSKVMTVEPHMRTMLLRYVESPVL